MESYRFSHESNTIVIDGHEGESLPVRCDKVDFLVVCEEDKFQLWYNDLDELADIVAEEWAIEKTLRVRCEGRSRKNPALRIYKVSTWGVFADNLLRCLLPVHHCHISRLDYRIECPVTEAGLAHLYSWMYNAHGGKRNVSRFSTRANNKTRGRAGGGNGVAVGSKNSPYRLAVYKRGNEKGAVEIQMQGKAAADIIATARTINGELHAWGYLNYERIMDAIAAHATRFVNQLTIDNIPSLCFMVGEPEADQTEAEREAIVRELRTILGELGESERKKIAHQLGFNLKDLM